MHNSPMRTTVTLDQEVYELAYLYSKGRGVTLGKAISELVRKGKMKCTANGVHFTAPCVAARCLTGTRGALIARSGKCESHYQ